MGKQLIGLTAVCASFIFVISSCNQSNKTAQQKDTTKSAATLPAPAALPQPASAETGHLLGVWYDPDIKSPDGQQVAYEIVSNKQKHIFIQVITFTDSKLTINDIPPISPTATELKKTGAMYVNKTNSNEFYKVDKAGNLLIYDASGLVAKCKKIL